MNITKTLRIALLAAFALPPLWGEEAGSMLYAQKIDYDMSGRQTSEVTEDGYESWQVSQSKEESKSFETDEGDTITITVNCGDTSATDRTLRSNWSKNITQKNSQLVGDAVVVYGLDSSNNTPHLTSESATMNFIISGLTAGSHTLLTYLNITDGSMTAWAPIDILVDGTTVLTGVEMSNQATLPSASGQAYISFTAEEGKDVTVSFVSRPESGATYTTTGIYVNAMVFDQPDPKTTALDPYPSHLDYHVDADDGTLSMYWTQATSAVKNIIYLGTSEDNMPLVAETDTPAYTATGLSTHNVYYWRVDQQDAEGNVYQGETWTFRPRRLAFPGAEGYGRYAIGGRGGIVYHVTSLDDNATNPQPGTFRYGISSLSGPRTIVFDVSGTIYLNARLSCSDSYVTVAGQTAPGKGIQFRGAPLGFSNDEIIRFVRMRRGFHNDDESDMNKGLDGLGMAGANISIMDHCSISWTIDEGFSSRNAKNITLQRTIISETLNNANHPNYVNANHGYAATIGGDTGSYHHNLLAHNEGRNWSLSGGLDGKGAYAGGHDVFNNVVYNWGGRATDGGTHECNFVNNYYKMGAATTQKYLLKAELEGTGTGSQAYYVSGNLREATNGTITEDAYGDTYTYTLSNGQVLDWDVFVTEPFFESYATIEPTRLAYKTVLSDVGANQPTQDDHDARMIAETLAGTYTYVGSVTGKKGLIDRESDSGGYEDFPEEVRADDYDTDQDGMPDWWEVLAGYDPAVADNNADEDGDGYTALEEYLNWLAEAHFTVTAGVENKIDLAALFAGFGSGKTYTYEVPNGIDAYDDDDKLVIAAPANTNALAAIEVTVSDADNYGTMTRTINLHISDDTAGIGSLLADSDNGAYIYKVYNVNGMLVRNDGDLSALAPGVYLLQVNNGKSSSTLKYIKR